MATSVFNEYFLRRVDCYNHVINFNLSGAPKFWLLFVAIQNNLLQSFKCESTPSQARHLQFGFKSSVSISNLKRQPTFNEKNTSKDEKNQVLLNKIIPLKSPLDNLSWQFLYFQERIKVIGLLLAYVASRVLFYQDFMFYEGCRCLRSHGLLF